MTRFPEAVQTLLEVTVVLSEDACLFHFANAVGILLVQHLLLCPLGLSEQI